MKVCSCPVVPLHNVDPAVPKQSSTYLEQLTSIQLDLT